MKTLLVLVAALALAGPALADGFVEAPALEPAASWVAGKPVKVWCGVTRVGQTYTGGLTLAGGSNIYVAAGQICSPLLVTLSGEGPRISRDFGGALQALVHEAEHAKGVRDESEADCASLKITAEVGIRFFGLRGQRRFLRDMIAAAWAQHRARPAAYTRLCP